MDIEGRFRMSLTPLKWTVDDYHRLIATGLLADRDVLQCAGLTTDELTDPTEWAWLRRR